MSDSSLNLAGEAPSNSRTARDGEDYEIRSVRAGDDESIPFIVDLCERTAVPTITPLYDGKVIAVQVYPRRDESGSTVFESLLIRDGTFFRAKPDGSTERLN